MAPKPPPAHLDIGLGGFHDIPLGTRIKLAGGASPGDVGRIVIYADPAPFDHFRRIGTTHADRNGAVAFAVNPDRNTRYRVATPRSPGASDRRVVAVYVLPRTRIVPFLIGAGRVRLVNTAKLYRGAHARPARVYFYFRRSQAPRYRRVGSALAGPAGRSVVRAVLDFPLHDPRKGDQVIACTRGGYAPDMGRANARIAACGARTIGAHQLAFRAGQ
jgi:hypothetical protein